MTRPNGDFVFTKIEISLRQGVEFFKLSPTSAAADQILDRDDSMSIRYVKLQRVNQLLFVMIKFGIKIRKRFSQ